MTFYFIDKKLHQLSSKELPDVVDVENVKGGPQPAIMKKWEIYGVEWNVSIISLPSWFTEPQKKESKRM